jgi:hypothetical protein
VQLARVQVGLKRSKAEFYPSALLHTAARVSLD